MPEDLGTKLHHARECHGVSLSQIANSTKIPVSILEAIESNDISRLPVGVYGRGFVRSFATEVGLDPDAAVAEFDAQFPLDSLAAKRPTIGQIEKYQTFGTNHPLGPILVCLTAISVAIAALNVYFGIHGRWQARLAAPSRGDVVTSRGDRTKPNVRSAVVAMSKPPTSLASPGSPASSSPSSSPSSPPTTPDGAAPAAVSPAPGLTSVTEIAPVDTQSTAGAEPTEEKTDISSPISDRLVVAFSVTRPSWVIATLDGKSAVSRLFQVGEQETFEVRHDLVLTAGDAGAIVMTLNGTEARSIGGTGETLKVRIDRTNFKKYLAPQ